MEKNKTGIKEVEPEWLSSIRKQADQAFTKSPMPTPFEEEYRYTSLHGLDISLASRREKPRITLKGNPGKGVIFMDMEEAVREHEPLVKKYLLSACPAHDKFSSLSMALWSSGVFLYVPANVAVSEPLSASFIAGPKSSFSHTLIILENGASVNYCEDLSSDAAAGDMISSGITEAYIGQNSQCSLSSFQNLGRNAWDFSLKYCALSRDARISWNLGIFGGKLSRVRQDSIFIGEGSSSDTTAVFSAASGQHVDLTTNARHTVPNTSNRILAKGVMSGTGSSVYRGLIKIDKVAQKTDSYLANNILLLSEKSLANSIPGLKIDANDVKASHGATVGQIDEEQVFYLMARGLSRKEAEGLIVEGFFEPAFAKISSADIRNKYAETVGRLMEAENGRSA